MPSRDFAAGGTMRVLVGILAVVFLWMGSSPLAQAQCSANNGSTRFLSWPSTSMPCGGASTLACVSGGYVGFPTQTEYDLSFAGPSVPVRDSNPDTFDIQIDATCTCAGESVGAFIKWCYNGGPQNGEFCGLQSGTVILSNCSDPTCPGMPASVGLNQVCLDYGVSAAPPAGTLNAAMTCTCQAGLECRSDGTTFDRCVNPPPPPGAFVLVVNPNSYSYGNRPVGSITNQIVNFRNIGTGTGTGCSVGATPSSGFIVNFPAACSTMDPGESCLVTLGANPLVAGTDYISTLNMSCLQGSITTGNFSVRGDGGSLAFSFSPNSFDMGNVTVGSTSTQSVQVTNTSTTNATSCTVQAVTGTPGFSQSSNCSSILAGGTCTVNLTAAPLTAGPFLTPLRVSCAEPGTGDSGDFYYNAADGLSFSFTPNTHSFGNVTVGLDSDPQSVQITNASTLSATGCTVSLQGAGAAQFDLTGGATCANLAAGASCTVSLLGRPASAGAMTSQIRIACAEPGAGTSGNFTMNAVPPVVPSGAIACVNSAINCSDYDNELLTPIPMCGGSGCVSCGGPTPFVGVAYDLDGTGRCSCRTRQERVWEDCGLRLFDDLQFVRTSCTGPGGGSVGICSALMTMSPNTGNLGTVNVNSTSPPITIQINNPTATAATGCTASLLLGAGPPAATAANFTLTSGCSTVPANGSCNLTLTGTPTTAATYQTGVQLVCSGGITTPVSSGPAGFMVTGQNSAANLSISNNGDSWTATQGTAFSRTLTISNSGGTTVSGCVLSINTPGVFSIGSQNCNSIAAAGSCSVTIVGDTNNAIGATNRTLSVNCSGGVSSLASFSLTVTAPTPACEISVNDCNKAGGSCSCASGFIKVAKPDKVAVRVPCGTIEVAELKKRAAEAIAKKDWKLLYLIKPILDSLCPDAFAQAVTCSGGTCTESLLELCNNNSLAACSRTITYNDLGSTPTGCTPLAASCTTTITCPAWTPSGGMFSRSCTIANDCFNKTSNTCMPYNNETLFPASPIVQRIQGSPVTTEGTMMCIPDCDNYGGVSNTGLRFVWSGPNAGQCACASGWVFNFISGRCQPPELMTGCNEGSGSVPPSQVSPFVTSTSGMVGAFRNAVNKKLNCCLNGNPKDFVGRKFDCVDNTINAATTFEALWASRDDDADGGQLNAVVLAGAGGRPLTGFYSIDGKRDPRFSEMTATALTRVRINPVAGAITATLGTITKPSGTAFDALVTGLGNLPAPTSVADRIRSPILVRAAAIYDCPRNPVSNIPLKTLQTLTAGVVTKEVCPVAATAKIHIRIEQVSEIIGAPPMKTIDTVIESSQVPSLSIEKLLNQKYGPGCAPGLFQQGEGCVYDVP